jgi:hypothetical protein
MTWIMTELPGRRTERFSLLSSLLHECLERMVGGNGMADRNEASIRYRVQTGVIGGAIRDGRYSRKWPELQGM